MALRLCFKLRSAAHNNREKILHTLFLPFVCSLSCDPSLPFLPPSSFPVVFPLIFFPPFSFLLASYLKWARASYVDISIFWRKFSACFIPLPFNLIFVVFFTMTTNNKVTAEENENFIKFCFLVWRWLLSQSDQAVKSLHS